MPPGYHGAHGARVAAGRRPRRGKADTHIGGLDCASRMNYAPSRNARWRAWTSEIRETLALAYPLAIVNLAQVAIGATDVIMVGWLGPNSLAAATLGANLFYLLYLFGVGLGLATAPMMAQAMGQRQGNVRNVRATVMQGFLLCGAYCIPCWVLLRYAEELLILLGQDHQLAADAQEYMDALQWGLLPSLCFVVSRSFLAAVHRPRPAAAVTVLAVLLNAALDWVLIFGNLGFPELGLVGAGLSSTVSNVVMLVGVLAYCAQSRSVRRYRILSGRVRPDWTRLREMCRIGIPIALSLGVEMTFFLVVTFLMGLMGAAALAAHAIVLQVVQIAYNIPVAVGQAATVRVALAAGRGDLDGVQRAGWSAYLVGAFFMLATAVTLLCAPVRIVEIFLDVSVPENGEAAALAAAFLGLAGLFHVFDGGQVIGSGVLRGLMDTRMPMLFTSVGYWAVGLPFGIVLAFHCGLGGLGLWVGLLAGLVVLAG
ncbi:MATE family efflux transporter (plasmid) [Azospirillum argentinense]|nr:MATE family efflux transporter [Azospirillum argentinense]